MRASLLVLMGAAGCTAQMARQEPVNPSPADTMAAPASPAAANTAPAVVATASATVSSQNTTAPRDTDTAVTGLLAYADRVRSLTPVELGPEFARLGEVRSPSEQMQLALALAQTRQTADLIRAQDLLTRILANAAPEALVYHPLARLLANRFGEQRRFEDLFDKQVQQTRDIQRRLDQTAERLEALKAIERSLGTRVPAAVPAASASSKSAGTTSRPRQAP